MKTLPRFLWLVLIPLAFTACDRESQGEATGPTITLSTRTPYFEEHIEARGSGFTPNSNVTSYLARPNGTEYPELPIMTDSDGAFVHDIDTLLMDVGTYEWWVVDDPTERTSNIATFEVTRD